MRKYSIGLDIGTASVGWVCLDENYQILKHNNRYAIGVHEFESAKSAADRRIQRSTRRRYNRRKKRIQLLQDLFKDYMTIDSSFFSPNNTKHFWSNDNQFENRTLTETLKKLKMNPKQIPTIYHLRVYLQSSTEKEDLRLIYLALHNLVKYRGNFLNDTLEWGQADSEETIGELFSKLLNQYNSFIDVDGLLLNENEQNKIEQILMDNLITKSDRVKQIQSIVGKRYEMIIKLILGQKTDAHKIFPNSSNMDFYKENKVKIHFASDEFESQLSNLEELEVEFIESTYNLYQLLLLRNILGDSQTIAHAKVKAYERFKTQLKQLKYLIDKYAGEEEYKKIFITSKSNIREYNLKPKSELLCLFDQYLKSSSYEESFMKYILKLLKDMKSKIDLEDEKLLTECIMAIENGDFLKKQRNKDNVAIPHQNNVYEAEKIIRNQMPYYSFMTEEWLSYVLKIIKFRIPYYIGPLGESTYAWMERKTDDNITPWNFDSVVNKAASAQKFIERMTNNCTYLKNEKVLPKNSLIYQKFELLNELNGIQIRGENDEPNKRFRLDYDLKIWVIENIFKQYKEVTHKKFLSELKKYPGYRELDLEGKKVFGTVKEDRFASNLKSFIDFKDLIEKYGEENVEKIIFYLTLFNEKSILISTLKKEISQITEEHCTFVAKKQMTGWGRLSKKLLEEVRVENAHSLIEYMEKFPLNFMEILSQTDLKNTIKQLNPKNSIKKIKYSDIHQLAGSPALKRGIWRAIKIVEELTTIFGEPKDIMIEVAREDGANIRTKSRKNIWLELGKEFSDANEKEFHKSISSYPEDKFKNIRFWLYALQEGKCLYTKEPLYINELHLYEVDHIYPRNFVVDNSIDNLALVKKRENQVKSGDQMPLSIIPANKKFEIISWWERLAEKKLISPSKLYRLKKESFNEADKERFINRQLVETRQIISNVKDLLEERFAETTIHLVKAKIVSNFRESLKVPKNRDYNNKHHAVDAFLMTLLIQFIKDKYEENFLQFTFKNKERSKKWSKIAQNNKEFFVFKNFKEEKLISVISKNKVDAVKYVNEIVYELPWQTTKMTGSSDGMFYKETIFSPKVVPDIKYQSPKTDRFVHKEVKNYTTYCIEYVYTKKNKKITDYKLCDLKVIETYQINKKNLATYLIQRDVKEKVKAAKIVYELPKYQKILINNFPYYFISTGELHNAKQWILPQQIVEKINNESLLKYDLEQLKELFNEIITSFFIQYPIFNTDTFRKKVEAYIKNKLVDVETFHIGLNELYKSAAANATRSEVFGSRINKKASPKDLLVVYESITGLNYRKPKSLKSFIH